MSSVRCTFCCFNEATSNCLARVSELVFVPDSKAIQFTEILEDVLTLLKPIDADSQICHNCFQTVVTFYKFKQNVPENLIFASSIQQHVMRATSDFFEKTDEEIFTMEHLSCLSFVPASKVDLMKNFNPLKKGAINVQGASDLQGTSNVQSSSEVLDASEVRDKIECSKPLTTIRVLNWSAEATVDPTSETKPKMDGKRESSGTEILDDSDPLLVEVEIKVPKKRGRKRKLPQDSPPIPQSSRSLRKKSPVNYNDDFQLAKFKSDPDAVEPRTLPNGLPLNYKLSADENYNLWNDIRNSKVSTDNFQCTKCHKMLSSYHSMRYHIISKHIMPRNVTKDWIGAKIREAQVVSLSADSSHTVITWQCPQCSKVCNSAPSIRYHLTKHLQNDFEEDGTASNSSC